MTAAKYFGEEKLEDAIYAIYLRKVRYVSPINLDSSVFPLFFCWTIQDRKQLKHTRMMVEKELNLGVKFRLT